MNTKEKIEYLVLYNFLQSNDIIIKNNKRNIKLLHKKTNIEITCNKKQKKIENLKEAYYLLINNKYYKEYVKTNKKNGLFYKLKKYIIACACFFIFICFMDIMVYFRNITCIKEENQELKNRLKNINYILENRINNLENIILKYQNTLGIGQSDIQKIKDIKDFEIENKINKIPQSDFDLKLNYLLEYHGIKKYKLRYQFMIFPVNLETGYIANKTGEFAVLREFKQNDKIYYYIHTGIDIGSAEDASIYSMTDGKVINKGYNEDGGNYVIIESEYNNKKFIIKYFHLEEIEVENNDVVKQGQRIGIMGNSGRLCEGRHLHLEIWENNICINPVINSTWNNPVILKLKK